MICNTKKKAAVLIGINYFNTKSQLNGCINDAKNLKKFLVTHANYKEEDIVLLTDDQQFNMPTKQNIKIALNNLVDKANSGYDEVWFSYSGHGSQKRDYDGDEADGMDEYIIPCDSSYAGIIDDDWLHKYVVSRLPTSCNMVCLMDCCHSGTILDLPFVFKNNKLRNMNFVNQKELANIIKLSGCMDNQTSSDISTYTKSYGAMTHTFLKILKNNNYCIDCKTLVNKMNMEMNINNLSQRPVLSMSNRDLLNKMLIGDKNTPPSSDGSNNTKSKWSKFFI